MGAVRELVVRTNGPRETRAVGVALARSLPAGATVSLEGPLGAGKTVLVSGLCEGLGAVDDVTSPTFTLVNEYATVNGSRVIHVDCFRLTGPAELEGLGLDDRREAHTVMVVEWGDRVRDALPPDTIRVSLRPDDEDPEHGRRIAVHVPEGVAIEGLGSPREESA
jgi:tRNA threonylcarbamoyladenosine biosynthesis protein TsaE